MGEEYTSRLPYRFLQLSEVQMGGKYTSNKRISHQMGSLLLAEKPTVRIKHDRYHHILHSDVHRQQVGESGDYKGRHSNTFQ